MKSKQSNEKNKKSWFIRFFVDPCDKLSKWLKNKTTQNSQDWILAISFWFGSYLLYKYVDAEAKDKLTIFVLWATFIAIMWYTKETFYLKQVQEKQLNLERDKINFDRKNYKLLNTISLIQEFNEKYFEDAIYIISDQFDRELSTYILPPEDSIDENQYIINRNILSKVDRVLSFFEKSGLMVKNNLIDFDTFFENSRIIFPQIYNNQTVKTIMEENRKKNSLSWMEVAKLKDLFQNKLK